MLFTLFLLVLVGAVVGAGYWAYRVHVLGDTRLTLQGWLGPRPFPRLGVTEQVSIDGRRKLVLVRRDDVEHLLMIGGPVDLVVEDKIPLSKAEAASKAQTEPGPVFTRAPRSFGQAVNE
jgi:hypothetical protein